MQILQKNSYFYKLFTSYLLQVMSSQVSKKYFLATFLNLFPAKKASPVKRIFTAFPLIAKNVLLIHSTPRIGAHWITDQPPFSANILIQQVKPSVMPWNLQSFTNTLYGGGPSLQSPSALNRTPSSVLMICQFSIRTFGDSSTYPHRRPLRTVLLQITVPVPYLRLL